VSVVVDIKMMLDKVESSWTLTQNTRLQKEHKETFVSCVLADVRAKGLAYGTSKIQKGGVTKYYAEV